jgi:beta-lactamase superfamily II metal-dependent hydrolase
MARVIASARWNRAFPRTRWLLVAVAAAVWGCESPSPVAPPLTTDVALDGDCVVWITSVPTRGEVRFGRAPGQYSSVAYPAAAGRFDRRFTTQHRVPLLGIAAGQKVYLQLLDEPASGNPTVSAEYAFTYTSGTNQRPLLRWTMIDVGFGDSHLLTMPGTGRHILIDAGERRDWGNVNRYLLDAAVAQLDAVIATHVHLDHIGGLIGESVSPNDGVLGAWPVGAFLEGPEPSAARSAYDELLTTLASRGIPRHRLLPGDTEVTNPALAWDPDVHVHTLHAGGGQALGGSGEDNWINNDSAVLRIGFGEVDIVLGGDAEAPAENAIVLSGAGVDSEVLKIHHHGVNDASSAVWLDAVNPRVGLIPIATFESYDGTLPTTAVLGRLEERRIHVYTSDRAEPLGLTLTGDRGIHVTVVTDGVSYQVDVTASASVHYPGTAPVPNRTGAPR